MVCTMVEKSFQFKLSKLFCSLHVPFRDRRQTHPFLTTIPPTLLCYFHSLKIHSLVFLRPLPECSRKREQQLLTDSGESIDNQQPTLVETELDSEAQRRCRRLQCVLGEGLTAFLAGTPGGPHSLRRLLASDVKQLFRQRPDAKHVKHPVSETLLSALPIPTVDSNVRINVEKGGYKVTSYLTID
ncbi:uncharacterized protein DEA37_0011990, partial [Paragonimus westermani]